MPEDRKTVSLSKMSVGQKGHIREFVVESDDCERIEEMGVTPGEHVEVVRYAPIGRPHRDQDPRLPFVVTQRRSRVDPG